MSKIGIYVKNGMGNLANRLFGVATKSKKAELKSLNIQKIGAFSNRRLTNALIGMEIQKSQALEYLHRFQNR